MNEKTLKKLEYSNVLQLVSQYAVSRTAREKVMATLPSSDFDEINYKLKLTTEAYQFINNGIIPELGFDEIIECAQKARVVSTLTMKELLSVMRILRLSRSTKGTILNFSLLQESFIKEMAERIYVDKSLEEQIDISIVNEDEMSDNASDELANIRKKIKKVNSEIRIKLASYTKSKASYLQDAIVTMRAGRYVIPVKQEFKGSVEGLIHDQSASGSTVFIEPIAVVNLNNELKTLTMQEAEEIERILQEFTKQVSAISNQLITNQDIISDIDVMFAKARYGIETRSILPKINNKGFIDIKKGRHPLLSKDKVVPITVYLGKEFRIIVVTGPNTGGKTVTLKTIGLFCLMAYSGMYVPAGEGTELTVFEDIFCDIGDEQSITQNLSTFSSHIKNISYILGNVNEHTLVLFDELGAGTEPNEGSAIALAVTEYLINSHTRGVLTTHYSQLKEYSLVTSEIENASMEFNPETYAPTYRLVMGVPGSSNAIEIASRLGLAPEIIELARSKISAERISFESVLQNAERIRQDFLDKKDEVEQEKRLIQQELDKAKHQNKMLQEEREKLLRNSKIEAKHIIAEAQEEAKQVLDQLKTILERAELDEKTLFQGRSVAKTLKDKSLEIDKDDERDENEGIFTGNKLNPSTIKVGHSVFVGALNNVAIVTGLERNNRFKVKCGNVTTIVSGDDLYEFVDTNEKKPKLKSVSTKMRMSTARMEINLLGLTVAEAIEEVDQFIDEAVLNGLSEVRIVHGIGTGKLRAGLHEHFRKHRNVAEFRLGVYGEGESGVTILKLK